MSKLGYNKDILIQTELLKFILKQNEPFWKTLNIISELNDETMYIASGSVSQSVWNYQEKRNLMDGISDFDIIYFDENLSYEAEDKVIKRIEAMTKEISVELDIKNQARVHLWIETKWGRKMPAYFSSEDAISSWSSTASCVGVQIYNGKFRVFAPYGLNDTFGQIMRPNKEKVFKELYDKKVEKWSKKWDFLNVISW